MDMIDAAGYGGLFLTALGAATVVPMQSEAVLVGLIMSGRYNLWLLVAVASFGNIIGSVVNWCLGRFIERFRSKPWFPVSEKALARGEGWYRHYGKWSLLASWLPLVGDPITLVAGILREPLATFLLLVTIAKLGRYVVLALVTTGVM